MCPPLRLANMPSSNRCFRGAPGPVWVARAIVFMAVMSTGSSTPVTNAPLLGYGLVGDPGRPHHPTKLYDFAIPTDSSWGFNTYDMQNLVEAATFDNVTTGGQTFPAGSAARAWVDMYGSAKAEELAAAKLADPKLAVICETDMIVFPKALITLYKSEIVDAATGRVSIDRPKTLELLGAMFDEILTRFPQVDGFQIRVGETNVIDFPYHAGDGAVDYALPVSEQIAQYVKLISWLRDLICVKHGKILVFRTWDTAGFIPASPPRFHGDLSYYLNVTNAVDPHPLLYFSIKHTMLDYWRYVRFNPTLNHGQHAQIIEVECEREYEGKGAHLNVNLSLTRSMFCFQRTAICG